MAYNVGHAKITVRPDLDGFRNSLREQWNRQRKEFEKEQAKNNNGLKIDVNQEHLKGQIEAVHKKMDGLINRKRTVDVSARFNSREFRQQVKAALNSVNGNIVADADTKSAESKISKAAAKRTVKFDLDESALDSYMRNRRQLGIATLTVSLRGDADAENRLNAIARDRSTSIRINKIGDERLNVASSTTARVHLQDDLPELRRRVATQTTIRPVRVHTELVPNLGSFQSAISDATRDIKVRVRAEAAQARAETAELTRPETKNIFVNAHTRKAQQDIDALISRVGMVGRMATRGAVYGTLFTGLGIAAAGATPAIVAFGSALGATTGALLTLPGLVNGSVFALGALGLAVGGAVNMFSKLGESLEDGKLDMEAFKEVTENASPALKEFTRVLFVANDGQKALSEGFFAMQSAAENAFFTQVNDGLRVMDERLRSVNENGVKGFAEINRHMVGLSTALGSIAGNWAEFRFSDQGWADLNTQLLNTRGLLTNIVGAMDRWNWAWNDMATVGSYYLPSMGRGLRDMITSLQGWTDEARRSGEMVRIIENGIRSAKNIGDGAGATFRIMGDVLHAAGVNARGLADGFRETTREIEAWTSSLSGQRSMVSFFKEARTVGAEFWAILRDIGEVIAIHVTPMLSEFVQGFGPEFRQALGENTELIEAFKPVMRGMGEGLGLATQSFAAFGRMVAPIIRDVLPPLVPAFKAIAEAVGALAGPTVTMMGFTAALRSLRPFIAAAGAVLGRGGLAGQFLVLGTMITSVFGVFDDVLGFFTDLNDKAKGIPAVIGAIALAFKASSASMTAWNRSTVAAGAASVAFASKQSAAAASNIAYAKSLRVVQGANISATFSESAIAITRTGRAMDKMKGGLAGLRTSMGSWSAAGKTMMGLGKGILAVFGGWPGVLAGAAIGGVMYLFNRVKKNNEAMKASAELAKSNGEANKRMTEDMISGASEIDAVSNSLDVMIEKMESIAETGGSGSDGYKKSIELIDEMGISHEDLAEAVSGSANEYNQFIRANVEGREGGEELERQLDNQRHAFNQLQSAMKAMSPEQKKAYELFREIGKSGGEAEGSVNKVREALMLLQGTQIAVTSAAADLTNQFDSTKQRMDDFAGATLDANGNLDTTTSAGAALHEELLNVGDSIGNAVEQGMDVDVAFGQASDTMLLLRESAGLAGDATSENGQKWQELLDKYHLTPERIETAMILKTSEALLSLAGFLESVKQAESGEAVTLRLEDDEAREMIEQFDVDLMKVGENTYRVRLDADTEGVIDGIDTATEQLGAFDKLSAKPFADLDPSKFNMAFYEALHKAGVLDEATPTALMDLNIDGLTQKEQIVLLSLIDLDSMKPTPEMDLVIDSLLEKVGLSRDEIESLKEIEPADLRATRRQLTEETEKAKEDWRGAVWAIGQDKAQLNASGANARSEMNRVKDHWENMTLSQKQLAVEGQVTVMYKGTSQSGSRAAGLAAAGKDGDFVGPVVTPPGYASGARHKGYRLPTQGPGTETVDGFTAFDSEGVPSARLDTGEWVINGGMSERYNAELAAINAGTFPKLPGFAAGGGFDLMSALQNGAGQAASFGSGFMSGVTGSAKGSSPLDALGIGDPFAPLVGAWETVQSTINSGWQLFQTEAQTAFQTVQANMADPFTSANETLQSTWSQTQDWMNSQWSTFSNQALATWTGVQGNVTSQFTTMQNNMTAQWTTAKDNIDNVYRTGIVPVFNALQGSLNTVESAFGTAVQGIGNYWDRTRELSAAPVRYTIREVFNGGLVGMWNSTNDLLDTKRMSPYSVNFHTGGSNIDVLPGYTPGRDPHTFVDPATGMSIGLSGGESIMRPEVTAEMGEARVDSLNAAARIGGRSAVRKHLGQFANGGIVDSMRQVMSARFPMLQFTSGLRFTDNGYHSKGQAADFSNGGDSTPEMRAATNWVHDNYRKQTIQLIHSPSPYNIGGGAKVGDGMGYYNPGTMAEHRNHVHWAVNSPVSLDGAGPVPAGFIAAGGDGGGFDMAAAVADAMSEDRKKFDRAVSGWNKAGLFNTLPNQSGTQLEKAFDKVIDKKADEMSTLAGGLVSTAGIQNGPNREMGKKMAARVGWTGDKWNALDKLWQNESGWNHLAQNPTSTAYGIPQFLDATWGDYGFTKTSDPKKQIQAGISYIQRRPDYQGDPRTALSLWNSRSPHWYDEGGYLMPGVTKAQNDTGKPEPVFTAEQWQLLRKAIVNNFQNMNWEGVAENLQLAADVIVHAFNQVDWEDVGYHVGNVARESFIEGQTADALGVFGIPSPDSIPIVKAMEDLNEALRDQAKEEREARTAADKEAREAEEEAEGTAGGKTEKQIEATKEAYKKANERTREIGGTPSKEDLAAERTGLKPGEYAKGDKDSIKDAQNAAKEARSKVPSAPTLTPNYGANRGKQKVNRNTSAAAMVAGAAAPLAASAGAINPALGAAVTFAAGAVKNATNSTTKSTSGATYNIYANSVDEGMRRAQMHDRQSTARSNVTR